MWCFTTTPPTTPPLCGIHGVALVQSRLPIDPLAPHLGHIDGYVCPKSGQLVG
jgi:hypothetical protein